MAATALALTLLPACALRGRPQFKELLWPEPPQTPRIKFVGLIRNKDDLGRPAADLFTEALVGRKEVPQRFSQPMGVAPSQDGKRLYVTDYAKPAVYVVDFDAHSMKPLGGPDKPFRSPLGVAVDAQDNVYVVDALARAIRVFDAKGEFVRNITDPHLERPTGIAIDSNRRRVYVADSAHRKSNDHVVHIFDLDGTYVGSFGGRGSEPGKFFFPTYVAVDQSGNIYVTDTLNARVQVFDPEGHYLKTFGQRGDAFGMFDKPKGVALDTFGNVYVVDSAWSNVQIFNQRGQVLLFFGGRGRFPGLLFNPTGIAIDRTNRIYVADAFNRRVAIYQLINTTAADSIPTPDSEQVRDSPGGDGQGRAGRAQGASDIARKGGGRPANGDAGAHRFSGST